MRRSGAFKWSATFLSAVFLTLFLSLTAFAQPGWNQSGNLIWYEQQTSTGETVRPRGLTKIGNYYYYFSAEGYLKTGWVVESGKYRFFRMIGKPGTRGRMYRNVYRKAGRRGPYRFLSNGDAAVGLQKINGTWYFLSTSRVAGERGLIVTSSFAETADGRTIYLTKAGKIARSRWVRHAGNYYYLEATGNLARNKVTPDGWKVDENGVRISGNDGGTSNGGENGKDNPGTKATTGKASILILCGHGQGDSGALGMWKGAYIQEQAYTRDFGTRIYNQLLASGKVNVDIFNKDLDMYQQNRNILNSVIINGKTLQSRITGGGTYKKRTLATLRKYSYIPDPMKYDYVLEVHFDASGTKDYYGDGRMKGVFVYVNSLKKNTDIDLKITYAINSLGMPIIGPPVWKSSGLLNARVYTELGVSYGLLETCFIDDRDDMKFYHKHRTAMAKAVSDAIISYFS